MWRVRICVCKDFASQIFLCMGLRFLAEKLSDLLFHVRAELGIPENRLACLCLSVIASVASVSLCFALATAAKET